MSPLDVLRLRALVAAAKQDDVVLADGKIMHRKEPGRAVSIADAMRYASLAAGMTCARRGADPPRRAEVDASLDEPPR